MSKHVKRDYELKERIVKEILEGKSYAVVSKKYEVLPGTIANWKRKYLNGTLKQDNRGKPVKEIEDIEILKKSYALLMEIRKKHPR